MRVVPDFEIDENLIKTESERLLSQIKENADKNNLSVVQAAVRSYPVIASMLKNQEESTEDELKQAFSKIIRDEYKWTSILSFVYQNKVTDKPKPEDLEKIQENAKKEPEMYGFRKDTPEEEIKNAIVDRIIRQVAFTWIVNQVTQANSQNLSAEQNQNTSNSDQDKKTKTKTKQSK
jgi:hypothetical protein